MIKEMRETCGYSLEEVAEKTGTSLKTLELVEKGKCKISFFLLVTLLDLYGYDVVFQERKVADQTKS